MVLFDTNKLLPTVIELLKIVKPETISEPFIEHELFKILIPETYNELLINALLKILIPDTFKFPKIVLFAFRIL